MKAETFEIDDVVTPLDPSVIEQPARVGDGEFLGSMIPNHAGAILMCQQASITVAEVRELCGAIIESQRREIETMKQILDRRS